MGAVVFALALGVVTRAYIMNFIKLPYTVQILVVSKPAPSSALCTHACFCLSRVFVVAGEQVVSINVRCHLIIGIAP